MTDKDFLSQEEIDALLKQSSEDDYDSDSNADMDHSSEDINDVLTLMEQDALGEIGNITFGSASTALSTLLGKKVEITTPRLSIIHKTNLIEEFPKPHVAVHVRYVDGFEGINSMVIKTLDAQIIADLMLGGDGTVPPEELNEIHISAVQEAMNQMMGSSATSMSTIFNRFVNISPPGIDILNLTNGEGVSNLPDEDIFIKVSFRLIIEGLIDSTLMQLIPVDFAKELVSSLLGDDDHTEQAKPIQEDKMSKQVTEKELSSILEESLSEERNPPQQHRNPPERQRQQSQSSQERMGNTTHTKRNVNVQPVQYSSFSPGGETHHSDEVNLNLLLDIPLRVTVELGRTQRLIKDILEFTQGSIIELDKLAGEPVDILVNNKLIAKGEVVVIDENFGVRVTEIVSQIDRIQKLQ